MNILPIFNDRQGDTMGGLNGNSCSLKRMIESAERSGVLGARLASLTGDYPTTAALIESGGQLARGPLPDLRHDGTIDLGEQIAEIIASCIADVEAR
jgi:hypothetical protein